MDFEAMSQEILRLAKNYPLRREMARIGFERVKSLYTYEMFIETYRKIYQEAGEVKG
jgi:glycosyltransferase involved in cell wall biosynthesis